MEGVEKEGEKDGCRFEDSVEGGDESERGEADSLIVVNQW